MNRRPFRRGTIVFLFLSILIISILFYRSRLLIVLPFEDGADDAIYPAQIIPQFPSPNLAVQQPLIPKIIHHGYANESIPRQLREGQQDVKDLHLGWKYMLWTEQTGRDFIQRAYPKYIDLYDSYPYTIQRVDVLRYFVLHYYGGIYLDLDISTFRPLDPLLQLPAFACRTTPTGISIDFLGSRPGHPFFEHVINSLETYNKNWICKYITVMYTTGPLFLSVMWVEYLTMLKSDMVTEYLAILKSKMGGLRKNKGNLTDMDKFKVVMGSEDGGNSYGFFRKAQDGSWHGKDVQFIFWMGRHEMLVMVVGFVVGFAVTRITWWIIMKVARFWEKERWWEHKALAMSYEALEDV